ncbi:MAG: hypothetical protein A2Y33_08220 [Spirochaetes bacterium GWF1_51_8]|nr:MAG: hypothetical protein A2Y33_08220 [Spirochaetes bacterium GWF1_51_8]
MSIIGKTTIHPALFYSGKMIGYSIWVLFLLSISNILFFQPPIFVIKILSVIIGAFGVVIAFISFLNLGNSTRLGLPDETTSFKSGGLYRFSRNPMYLGFDLLTVASTLYLWNIFIAAAGLYTLIIYHLIILGEEKFLDKRFGKEYMDYKSRVRRYI